MKLFDNEQVRRWDAATIERGMESIDLMERAAQGLVQSIRAKTASTDSIAILAGIGNNGGDALAIARLLIKDGYDSVTTYLIQPSSCDLSPECMMNAKRLVDFIRVEKETDSPSSEDLSRYDFIVDGLFGSGLSRTLEGIWKQCVESINGSNTQVISIDIPSGAYADRLENKAVIVEADLVLSLQIPKRVFMFPESQRFMKGFEIIDIGLDMEFHDKEPCDYMYLQESDVPPKVRMKFSHKGAYGHALLIAGSKGMYGAAQLSARACLRSGLGLLTVHSAAEAMPILQTTVPEAMYSSDERLDRVSTQPDLSRATAIAIGPGLGQYKGTISFVDEILDRVDQPLVLDADALNIIAKEDWQERIPVGSIITPHPKEFERLFGCSENNMDAVELQRFKAIELKIIVIRKGAHTSIALPDGRIFFNSTGNPYMAIGGMGDILTGYILGLLAQGYSAQEAALAGVWRHGAAGDRALKANCATGLSCGQLIDTLF